MLLGLILTALLVLSLPAVHAAKKSKGSRRRTVSTSPMRSPSPTVSTVTVPTTSTSVSMITPSSRPPINLDAFAMLDNTALLELASIINAWPSFSNTLPSSLRNLPTALPTLDREDSDPGSEDFPLEVVSRSPLASEEDEVPPPPTQHTPIVRPVRKVPLHLGNASFPAQPTGTSPLTYDDFITQHLRADTPYKLRCWQGPETRSISPIWPKPLDCLKAIDLIVHGDKKDAPMLFSEQRGYMLPRRIAWNSCAIVMTMSAGPNAVMTTTFANIKNVIKVILQECLDPEKDERGGMFTYGKMNIAVSGRVAGAPGESNQALDGESYGYGPAGGAV